MSHPEELLAGYVDGSLAPAEREEVELHLRGCARCREDVTAAERSRNLLKELPEVPAPDGLARRAVREAEAGVGPASPGRAGTRPAGPGRTTPTAYRWVAAAAAAAAVFSGVVTVVRNRSQEQTNAALSLQARPDAAEKAAARNPGDLTGMELQGLADAERRRYLGEDPFEPASPQDSALIGAGAGSGSAAAEPGTPAASASPAPEEAAKLEARDARGAPYPGLERLPATGKSERCLEASGGFDGGGRLLRIYEARALGVPAYFGVFLQGPEPGAQPDRIVVWVAARRGCDVIGFSQAFLDEPSPAPPPPGFDFPSP
jgi:hypothetical protein